MTRIAVLFTCFNRIEKTSACIDFVERAAKSADCVIDWFITDGGSSDGTTDVLSSHIRRDAQNESVKGNILPTDVNNSNTNDTNKHSIHYQTENGAFYSQGMKKCMEMLDANVSAYTNTLSKDDVQTDPNSDESDYSYDYVMLVNDDVEFFEDFLVKMLDYSAKIGPDKVIVGATCACSNTTLSPDTSCGTSTESMSDSGITGNRIQSYGGVRYKCKPGSSLSIKYSMVSIDDSDKSCDTFNANCVLIPWKIYSDSPRFDEHFIHGLGDFDYGLSLKGEKISSDFFVGICNNNSKAGTWMDATLPVSERLSKLNSVKGAPTKQWFYYLRKHFGIAPALIHSMSPYIRILLGK